MAGPWRVRRGTLLRGAALLPLAEVASCAAERSQNRAERSPSAAERSSTGTERSPSGAERSPEGPPRPRVAGELATGLAVPWGLAFLPDGSAIVSCRESAQLIQVRPGQGRRVVGRVTGVVPQGEMGGEGGLLGIALHPDFPRTPWLYAFHTASDDDRVVRFRWRGPGTPLGPPEVLLDGLRSNTYHHGGALAFGPDRRLYVSVGDSGNSELAQDTSSLHGKILRLTDTGDRAPGNPFDNPVWSYGHRNIEGLAFDDRGRLWASEFGDHALDELNRIVRGGNYGWPKYEGPDHGAGATRDPLAWWPTEQASPAGIAIARGRAWLGALQGEYVLSVDLATGRTRRHLERHGRIRLVAAAPDGSLWAGTSNRDGRGDVREGDDRILRVTL